jgi:hypothetical protein
MCESYNHTYILMPVIFIFGAGKEMSHKLARHAERPPLSGDVDEKHFNYEGGVYLGQKKIRACFL